MDNLLGVVAPTVSILRYVVYFVNSQVETFRIFVPSTLLRIDTRQPDMTAR